MPTSTGTAADFIIIKDMSFDLEKDGNIQEIFDLQLPPDTAPETAPIASGALSWNVRAETSGTVTYEVRVNGEMQTSQTVSATDWQTVRETFDTSLLKLNPAINKIEFRVTGGNARLSIGDPVLWFRKQIFDPHTEQSTIIPIATVADFVVIKDKSFDLQKGSASGIDAEKDFTVNSWPLDEDLWLLMWNVRTESSGTVEYEVRVNGEKVTTQSVAGSDWHMVQEALDSKVINQGINKIQFFLLAGSARMSVGDMTLCLKTALGYNVH